MSVMNAEIALGFVAKDMDLLFLALLDNGSINLCASNERLTNKSLVAFDIQHLIEANLAIFLTIDLLGVDDLSNLSFDLLAAG